MSKYFLEHLNDFSKYFAQRGLPQPTLEVDEATMSLIVWGQYPRKMEDIVPERVQFQLSSGVSVSINVKPKYKIGT